MEANSDDAGKIAEKMALPRKNFTAGYFGATPEQQGDFYAQLIYHVLVQMNTLGMKAVCLLAGHYPLRIWADPAIKRFHRVRRFAGTRAWCANEPGYANSPRAGGDHAGHWETSYLWYLRPDCVDLSVYRGRENEPLVGVGGRDPRVHASIELGRRATKLIVRGMVAKARQLVAEAAD